MKYIKDIFRIKYRIVACLIITLIAFVANLKALIDTAPNGINLSILDCICLPLGGGVMGKVSMTFPIVPIFLFILMSLLNIDNRETIIIKQKSRRVIWNKRVKLVAGVSFIYSLITLFSGYLISGVLIGSFHNGWQENGSILYNISKGNENMKEILDFVGSFNVLSLVLLGLFLGLFAIGMLTSILSLKLKNIYIYIITVSIVLWDYLSGKVSIFLTQMTLEATNWIDKSSIILNYSYLLMFIMACYIFGMELIKRKDFLK